MTNSKPGVKKGLTASGKFIFLTVLLDSIGLGIVIPVWPDLLRRYSTDPSFVAEYYGYFVSCYALMQFISSPALGVLSDRYGRRPVILLSLLGGAIDYLLMAFAPTLPLLFLGRLVSGFTGANYSVAAAYMADISDDSNRSANFGLIGAGFGVGFIVGPMIGGTLSGFGPTAPFIVAAIFTAINFLFGLFVIPESLSPEKRRVTAWSEVNPLKVLWRGLRREETFLLLLAFALMSLAGQVHPSNWTLYTQTKFGWTAMEVGWSLTFVGVFIGFSQGWLPRILVPKWGEAKAFRVGLFFQALGFFLFAFATRSWMMYAIVVVWSVCGVCMPAIQSMLSSRTPANAQGELQGVTTSLMSVTSIIGPILYSHLFTSFSGFLGVAYFTAALICLMTWILVKRARAI